ncbi:hypothetical protein [Methanosphaerula palustris]|uniref:hypothetical protein n=1 Tax=Methanosphaerula palustris TaxID=475088 RepID=UPI000326C637|nr:hypothetical protein [Methanosphaerula palustris]
MDGLESANATILTHVISSALRLGKAYTFAIDYTNDTYYGTVSSENEGYVIRSRLKKSTNEFYSYVTVYAITQDRQITLAVYPVTRGTSKAVYITRCLDVITTAGLITRALCLDREFYARKVIDFLITVQIPFIIPVRKHSRAMKQLLNRTRSRFGE